MVAEGQGWVRCWMVLVPGARACLLLQCLAQWVLLLLELEGWLLQRRVAAVPVPITAA